MHVLFSIGVAEKMSMSARIHRSMHVFPMQHVQIPLGTTHAHATLDTTTVMAVMTDPVANSHLRYTKS